jgi:hypothetical protein
LFLARVVIFVMVAMIPFNSNLFSAVVTPQTLSKHQDIFHSKMTCDCGMLLELRDYDKHQKESCPLRFESCRYCHVEMTFIHLQAHRDECANKTVPCERCHKDVRRKNMINHLAIEHGVNPSLRPDEKHAFGQPLRAVPRLNDNMVDASFIKREKGAQPTNVEFLSEDEQIAAALAQSLEDTPLTTPGPTLDAASYDDDALLQQALYESQRLADQNNDNKDQQPPTKAPSLQRGDSEFDEDVQPTEIEEIDDDTWDDDDTGSYQDNEDDDENDDNTSEHKKKEGDAQAAVNKAESNKRHKAEDEMSCPYCDVGVKNYEALEKHLEVCELADRDQ